jgi:predicted 2-oxoglutarate/Fe(II)-dependent dioxygenase YbiX/peroxiredoxin
MASILPGDPAPWFNAPTTTNPDVAFSQMAGRWIVLCFHDTPRDPATAAMLRAIAGAHEIIDNHHLAFCGVVRDAADLGDLVQLVRPSVRFFIDADGAVAKLYGVSRPQTLLIDRGLRLVASIAIDDPAAHVGRLLDLYRRLPRIPDPTVMLPSAPVLFVPMVLEPAFCRALIDHFESAGSVESGFLKTEEDGRVATNYDHGIKRRRDCVIQLPALAEGLRTRLVRRLFPEIAKAYSFEPTRIERYVVCRYDAEVGGYFRQHRDNTTKGTAHRRFAVTINLNAEEYEGGDLLFPEYDHRAYRAPTGGAVVFSCSLLHEALPVTRGRRYATVPFIYDEASARIRAANADTLADPELRALARADGQ